MNRYAFCLILVAAVGVICGCGGGSGGTTSEETNSAPNASILLSVDLSDNPVGEYVHSDIVEDFLDAENWNDGIDEGRVQIVDVDGEKKLRVDYPEGEYGTKETGAQFKALFSPVDTVCFSYNLELQDGFLFGRGAKLPGLGGGDANTGGLENTPSGEDGFSTRVMWREDGRLYQYSYLYSVEQSGDPVAQYYMEWQTSDGEPVRISSGESHTIEICTTMNTVSVNGANFDGNLQAYFDGEEVLGVAASFRSTTSLVNNVLYFSTFFGGSDSSWNSPQDQYIDFWNFRLSSAPITEP